MSVAALVLAAGRGERFGGVLPKAFVPLAGKPLLLHALEALAASRAIDWLVPVVARSELSRLVALASELDAIPGVTQPVVGGRERQDSVRAGLDALRDGLRGGPGPELELVAVHDAARPLVAPQDVNRVVAVARRAGAAILAVAVRDTIKRVVADRIVDTPERSECYAAQTPQVFRVELLREALDKAAADGFVGTDDAQLVERLGAPVAVVVGAASNLKVTDRGDLASAERWLASRAAGESG